MISLWAKKKEKKKETVKEFVLQRTLHTSSKWVQTSTVSHIADYSQGVALQEVG